MNNNNKLEKTLDAVSNQLINDNQAPFLHVLMQKDGKVFYDKVFGYQDADKKHALQKDSIYRVASQTKAVTSVAALMLWEQGKFLLDDPLSKYIPSFKDAKVLDQYNSATGTYSTIPAKREVTIRDIMSHTSGIGYSVLADNPGMAAIYSKSGVATGIGSVGVLKDQIEALGPLPLSHQPGDKFTYGLNTDILGYLIEIWSGESLSDYFETYVFKPLKMHNTSFKIKGDKKARLLDLFQKGPDGFIKVTDLIVEGNPVDYPLLEEVYFSGGAGLVSTVYDYAKFLGIFTGKGKVEDHRFLGAKTLAMATANQLSAAAINIGDPALRFGLGTALITDDNSFKTPVSPGSLYWAGAFNTQYWVDPKEDIIGLVYTQQYLPDSYWDLGSIYKNVIYSQLESINIKKN
jgi:CubicO group peptidase (beta-lactamase class C family)